jgi:hypothetical protein
VLAFWKSSGDRVGGIGEMVWVALGIAGWVS